MWTSWPTAACRYAFCLNLEAGNVILVVGEELVDRRLEVHVLIEPSVLRRIEMCILVREELEPRSRMK